MKGLCYMCKEYGEVNRVRGVELCYPCWADVLEEQEWADNANRVGRAKAALAQDLHHSGASPDRPVVPPPDPLQREMFDGD